MAGRHDQNRIDNKPDDRRDNNVNPLMLWTIVVLIVFLVGSILYYFSHHNARSVSGATPVVTAPSEMNPATRNPNTGELTNSPNNTASPPANPRSEGARTRDMVTPNATYPGADNQ